MRRTLLLLVLSALVALALSKPSPAQDFDFKEKCKLEHKKVEGCEVRCLLDDGGVKTIGMDENSVDCCKALDEADRSETCKETIRRGGRRPYYRR